MSTNTRNASAPVPVSGGEAGSNTPDNQQGTGNGGEVEAHAVVNRYKNESIHMQRRT